MEKVEARYDYETADPSYERTAQRDNLLIFAIHLLECAEMVRTEIEAAGYVCILSPAEFRTELRRTGHEPAVRIVLIVELEGEITGSEFMKILQEKEGAAK